MSSQVQEISPVVKQVNVVVDGGRLTRELDKAYRKLSETARIKGFRQGKIPRQVLERYFKRDVESDVLGRVIGDAYREAIGENKLEPVAQPEIQAGEFVPGQDFQFTAKVEVRPAITLKKYKGFHGTRTLKKVNDDAVTKEIETLRVQVSTVVPVENREVVQKGDLCTCNFMGTVDGQPFVGGAGNAYVIEPGAGRFFAEVEAAMPGKKVGEAFEVQVKLPDDFRTKEVAGKQASFRVTVTELKHRNMPALDDEFAKDLGDYDSLADLKQKIRTRLETRAKDEAEAKLRDEIMTQLIEANQFELPPSLVERQIDARLYQSFGRLSPDQLKKLGLDRTRLREDSRDAAVRQVRGALLLDAIATEEKLEVTDADMEQRFAKLAEEAGQTVERVRGAFVGERREDLRARMRTDKAMDHLISISSVTDKTE